LKANLKDLEGSLCENTNSIQVHFELNITQYGSNMVLSGVFQTELKAFETNQEWVLNIKRF
jgi:hypothetical protein